MSEAFESKVRMVGTSLGVLIPKEVIREEHLKSGEIIKVAVIKKDLNLIKKMFGSAKKARPFQREHLERVI